MAFISRTLEQPIREAAGEFPAIVVTGPRQSGKTTLLRRLFSASHSYVSVEPPDVRAAAVTDPRGFLASYPPPAIIDEVQYAPNLLPYIKERIDADRQRRGQYLLTGSQNLLLLDLRDPRHAATGPVAGAVFETAVLQEIVKTLTPGDVTLPLGDGVRALPFGLL